MRNIQMGLERAGISRVDVVVGPQGIGLSERTCAQHSTFVYIRKMVKGGAGAKGEVVSQLRSFLKIYFFVAFVCRFLDTL